MAETQSLYLDACCLNRPFDEQLQERVRLEAEAVLYILDRIQEGRYRWIGSDVFTEEIGKLQEGVKKAKIHVYLRSTYETVPLD